MVQKYAVLTSLADDALKKDIIMRVMQAEAEKYMEFYRSVIIQDTPNFEAGFQVPLVTRLKAQQVTEGTVADPQKIEFFKFYESMDKYQSALMNTDESYARNEMQLQMMYTMTAIARGLAWSKDEEIKNAIIAKAGKTLKAESYWTDPSASNVPGDFAKIRAWIISNTKMTAAELKGALFFYPAEIDSFVSLPARPNEYTTIGMSPFRWVMENFGVEFVPTTQIDTYGVLVYPGPYTAIHLQYDGSNPKLPVVENGREMGVGDKWVVTQRYKTAVIPNSKTDLTHNNRIAIISDICQARALN